MYKLDKKFTNAKSLSKPVISVGNITWGGTGKTPIVIELLNFLVKKKLKPAVLTRGYFRKNKKPLALLLNNGGKDINASDAGDEPLLIAKSVPQAYVIVGSDRYGTALKFKSRTNPDVYVLDDGFQHWPIQRNLDIACINAANPFGNGMLIPAGILREKPKVLNRAGIIVITNSDMVSSDKLQKLEKNIFDISGKKPYVTFYGDFEYKNVDLTKDFNVEVLKKSEVYLLSAVGFSDGFKNSVEKSGIKIKGSMSLRDHSVYTSKMLEKIISKSGKNSYFVITAKDAVKFKNTINADIKERFAVLNVKPQFVTRKQQWEEEILKHLRFF
jgi:tetraacyldisaccharide 4'-kinase